MKKGLLSLVVYFCVITFLPAQQEKQLLEINGKRIERCGSDSIMQELFKDPVFHKTFIKNQKIAREKIKHQTEVACVTPILIPVAVHYAGGVTTANEQCLIDKALEQIQVMNEDFGGYNTDIFKYCDFSTACPADYPPGALGGGACIEFCLADTGHPCDVSSLVQGKAITVGIYSSSSAPCWNGYLNFFVRNLGGGLLGFAPLNGANNPNGNGITMTTSSFGGSGGPCSSGVSIDNSGQYGLGRTGTHEAGHYFNLGHVFNGCGGGDGIADTPSQNDSNFGCPTINTGNCSSTSGNSCGTPDFWFNYMDYVNDACMFMFTELQCVAMNNSASPASKWAQNKCSSPGTYNPTYPNGCAAGPTLSATVIGTTDVICNGDATGTISLNILDGTAPYDVFANATSYGDVTVITGLTAGAYVITVNDAAGMSYTIMGSTFINEPLPIIPIITAFIDPSCAGNMDGSINATATGGTSPFQYSLDNINFQAQGFFTNLAADTYIIYVQDALGCVKTIAQTLSVSSQINLSEVENNMPLCFNGADGSLEVEATGGASPYSYELLSSAATNATGIFTGLTAGAYMIEVTDFNNCTASAEFTLTEPDAISFGAISTTVISCFGDATGVIEVMGAGGVSPYSYEIVGVEVNTDGLFEDLPMGIYSIVISDANDCTYSEDFTLTEPTEVILITTEIIPVTCGGNGDGSVTLSSSGGVGPYQYSNDGATYQTSPTFSNLSGGLQDFYTLDDNGCLKILEVDVMEASTLLLAVVSQQNVDCLGDLSGTVTVIATGGTGTINYTLDTATNTTGIFTGLTSGTYTISAVDIDNCPSSFMVEILATSDLDISISTTDDVSCFGENDGRIIALATGGAGSFEYSLDGINFGTDNIFNNLPTGNGVVYVQDASGCQAMTSYSVMEPDELTIALVDFTNLSCFEAQDGTISVTAAGGTGILNFDLLGDVNNTGLFTGLDEGSYTITVTDNNDCSNTIEVMITEPSSISFTITDQTNSDCDDNPIGGFTVTGAGGAGNYLYALGTEMNTTGIFSSLSTGNYNVTITDINDCSTTADANVSSGADIVGAIIDTGTSDPECTNGTNGSILVDASGGTGTLTFSLMGTQNTTGLFENLPAGNYLVSVVDDIGCRLDIPYELINPDPIQINTLNIGDLICADGTDGTAAFIASGGTGDLSYTLNGGSNIGNGLFNELSPANYTLTVTDVNSCTNTVDFSISAPDPLSATVTNVSDVSCFGTDDGQIIVQGTGGTGDYTYVYNGTTFSTGMITDLPAGMITFTVMDDNNCMTTISADIGAPDEITVNLISLTDAPCEGLAEGAIAIEASGGSGNFDYLLATDSNTTGNFGDLNPGNYSIQITDQNNCSTSYDFTISEGLSIGLEGTTTPDTGMGAGTITLTGNGGTGPYMFSLNNGALQNTGQFENLLAGAYTAHIVDANGCTNMITLEVDDRPTLIDWNLTEFINGPNPFREQYIFDYFSNGDQTVSFKVFANDGKFVLGFSQEALLGYNRMVLDSSNGIDALIPGAYILYIEGKRVNKGFKIVRM